METNEMSVVEHLTEIRNRLVLLLISITAVTCIVYVNALILIQILLVPMAKYKVVISYFEVFEGFSVRVKISLYAAIVILMPLILYQISAFISPGLTKKEKRILFSAILLISIFFISGVIIGYLFVLPIFIVNLLTFSNSYLNPALSGNLYFGFVGAFCLVSGLIFSIPALSIILGKMNIISPKQMKKGRKFLLIFAFILQGMIGYSGDLSVSLIILIPLFVLYEISILIISKTSSHI